MTQPTPNVTDADVERVVRRDFPAERVDEVLATGYTKKWFHIDKLPEDEKQRIIDADWKQYQDWLERR